MRTSSILTMIALLGPISAASAQQTPADYQTIKHGSDPYEVAFIDSKKLVISGTNGAITYDVETGKPLRTFNWFDAIPKDEVRQMVLSPNGTLLAALSVKGVDQGTLHLVDIAAEKIRSRTPIKDSPGSIIVEGQGGMYFSSDASQLAITRLSKPYVSYVNTANGQELGAHPGDYRKVVFSPNGRNLLLITCPVTATSSAEIAWVLYDIAKSSVVAKFPRDAVPSFAPKGDSVYVLMPKLERAGNTTLTVATYDLSGKERGKVKCPGEFVNSYSTFSPDGKYLGLCSQFGDLILFDRVKGTSTVVANLRDLRSTNFLFSPDSKKIAAYRQRSGAHASSVGSFNPTSGITTFKGQAFSGENGPGEVRVWEISKLGKK